MSGFPLTLRSDEETKPLIVKALFTDEINNYLRSSKWLGILYLDIIEFDLLVKTGKITPQHLANTFRHSIRQSIYQVIPPVDLISVQNLWTDDSIIFFALKIKPSLDYLSRLAVSLGCLVKEELNFVLTRLWGIKVELHTGYALLESGPGCPETGLSAALKGAIRRAQQQPGLEDLQRKEELCDIINNRQLQTVFQPLINLGTGQTMGFEALTRGPAGSPLYSPANLFPLAEQTGLLYKLEKTARELALTSLTSLPSDYKLFINTNPQVINDPEFVPGQTKKLINSLGLSPRNIVFEITERTSIKDFASFRQTLEHYRSQGYLIAVDDAGAGYSSLQSIAELCPDFIKMDMSLIREIDKSRTKKALVETFVSFAEKVNSKVIAEGIETAEELQVLIELGVPYGQGFYLGKPLPTF